MKERTKQALREMFFPIRVSLDDNDLERIYEIIQSDSELFLTNGSERIGIIVGNNPVFFSAYDSTLINHLRNYSPEVRINLMQLTCSEMQEFIAEQQVNFSDKLKKFLKRKHIDRISNDSVNFEDYFADEHFCKEYLCLSSSTSKSKLVSQVKKGIISVDKAERIFEELNEMVKDE